MERAERYGLGIAAAGHVALFVALSLSLLSARIPKPPVADPMDVQFVDKVGLTSAAPKVSQEAPAPSEAPEQGKPDDTTPPPPKAEPVVKPEPKPVPAPPTPSKPTPPKPEPKPEPKPAPVKPEPKAASEKPAKPQKAAPAKAPAKPSPAKPTKATGLTSNFLKDLPQDKPGTAAPKGSRLGSDFLKGLSPSKAPGKASAPRAAGISAQSMAGIGALIQQQVRPNYNPPTGGADASSIVTTLHITMAKDGTVSNVEVVGHASGGGSPYVRQADEAAIRAVRRSSPLHLPPDLYEGWQDITINFHPDQM